METQEQQSVRAENQWLKDFLAARIAADDTAYRDLMARVHNAARPHSAPGAGIEIEERLGFPAGHYYSETPRLGDLLHDVPRIWPEPPPVSIPGIDLHGDRQIALLDQISHYYSEQPWTDVAQSLLRYSFKNIWYCQGDALYLYGMLRHLRPRRLIEVGSGYSSAVTLDTNERFLDGDVQCTFIDPEPERLYSLLTEQDRHTTVILPQRVQNVDLRRFEMLQSGDILFIDSSHVSKCGSDVNHLLFEVFPRLRSGVYIHLHDIIYPFEYYQSWLEQGWHWNEAYLLRALLTDNPTYTIVLWADYLARFHTNRLKLLMPLVLENPGVSLWLRKM